MSQQVLFSLKKGTTANEELRLKYGDRPVSPFLPRLIILSRNDHFLYIIKVSDHDCSFPENDMNRDQVLEIIAGHREELVAEFGVKSLALFGSVVRDEATPVSDVDLLVEFDGRPVGLFHLSRTQHYLESILGVSRVDLVLRDGIKTALKEQILREAIYAA
jgi:uncharacterized protein